MTKYTYTVIIPARAGSKRLSGKNTMDLCGKSLVEWAFECGAQTLRHCGNIWITTDIIDPAPRHTRNIISRPACLALDDTPMIEVLKHAVSHIHGNTGTMPQHVILLQPTSPLRTVEDAEKGIAIYEEHDGKCCVVSTSDPCTVWHPWKPNGLVYIYPIKHILISEELLYAEIQYYTPPDRSIDIDTQADFDRAEVLMRKRLGKEV